ncbi:uncharacterized protein LOC144452096 [Glandiceps talaboti]
MAMFCGVFARFCRSFSSVALNPIQQEQQRSVSKIIDGKTIANQIRSEVRAEVTEWVSLGNRPPHLSVILVGDDPASASYVRSKTRAAKQAGISAETIQRPATVSEEELLDLVNNLNKNPDVDGILVQLPVPPHIDERTVCDSVVPEKDVDGFHVMNVGRFCLDQRALLPATPYGIMELIKRTGIDTVGKNAVVCGRSKNVGMPIAMLLHTDGSHGSGLGADSTVTICHRYTPPEQLRLFTKTADILVVAVGIPGLIKADMVKDGVVVIDVGINRVQDKNTGKHQLVGDVDFKGVHDKASRITPVPGGVGPMTVAMLMKNTLMAARKDFVYSHVPKPPPKIIHTREWKKFDNEAFKLRYFPWCVLEVFDHIDDSWECFQNIIRSIFDKHAPKITRRVSGNAMPWVTDEIRTLIYQRDYFRKKAENLHKPDKLWHTLKQIIPQSQRKDIHELNIDNKIVNEPKSIVSVFNEFFSTIGAKLTCKFSSVSLINTCQPNHDVKQCSPFAFEKLCAADIERELNKLSTKKAGGIDCIPSRVCKLAASEIARPLHYLFNFSLVNGVLPSQWKWGKVSPIYKDGDNTNPSNYRPITVLPVIMKVFEKFVHKQLYKHIQTHDLLNQYQSGFRPEHSTSTTLIDVSEYVLNNNESGLLTGVVFLDLKKAFDTVDVNILI